MRKIHHAICSILLLAASICPTTGAEVAEPTFDRNELFKVLDSATALVYVTLEPGHYPSRETTAAVGNRPNLWGFPILGSARVEQEDKKALVAAFKSGITEKRDGVAARCFRPRHAFRLVDHETRYEIVICYECLQVESQRISKDGRVARYNTLTTSDPLPVFHQLAKKYGLKEAG